MLFRLFFIFFNIITVITTQCSAKLIHLDIQSQMNHRACGDGADVDSYGNHYVKRNNEPAIIKIGGGSMTFLNPLYGNNDHNDNIRIQKDNDDSFIIPFPTTSTYNTSSSLKGLYLLISASHGPVSAEFKLVFKNGQFLKNKLVVPDWQTVSLSSSTSSHQIEKYDLLQRSLFNSGNMGNMYSLPLFINTTMQSPPMNLEIKILSSSKITPDRGSNGEVVQKENNDNNNNRNKLFLNTNQNAFPALHLFSATAFYTFESTNNNNNNINNNNKENNSIVIASARATRRYWKDVKPLCPIFIVRLHNTGNEWLNGLLVYISSTTSIKTVYPGKIIHLAPGHITLVDIGINIIDTINKHNEHQDINIKIISTDDNKIIYDQTLHSISLGLYQNMEYEQLSSSLQQHQAPTWFQDAKFGIFIHWGLFSVPAWAPVGKEYAEWYWWQMNHSNDPTYQHHLDTYGSNFTYDDFIPLWKPDQFNPRAWLDLIDDSGATYFVFTSKHHDGFSLFDTKVTNRSSVHMNPHRDFVHELITTSKKNYPHLKRGIYFSLPEWYNPYYHNDQLSDWHGPPMNPYTNKETPYTGNPYLKDFVNELQVPQFLELINQYEPDILWCDIGGINNSTVWQTEFFNQAYRQNRQVTINDRCGNDVSDFTTLEYQQTTTPPSRFWEATRGIDPMSFGYNQATPPSSYATTKELIHQLIDTIAMGGNFLLNIGPEANGNVFQTMVDRLKEIGQWLKQNHNSVFQSKPYWLLSQDDHVHYMTSMDHSTFYIFIMDTSILKKGYNNQQQLILQTPLPISSSSSIITSLDDPKNTSLPWDMNQPSHGQTQYIIHLPNSILNNGKYVWVLECNIIN